MSTGIVPAGGGHPAPAPVPAPAGGVSTSMPSRGDLARHGALSSSTPTPNRRGDDELVADISKELLAAGFPQAHLSQAIAVVEKHTDREARLIEQLDDQDEKARNTELRQAWGDSYKANAATAQRALAKLPPAVQAALLTGALSDGTLAANTAALWKWLLDLESGGGVSIGGGLTLEQEIAQIQDVMRNKRDQYNADPRMQARYRQLIEARRSGTPAPDMEAVENEIAEIEHIMRTDRRRYNGDTRMQTRLRTLYQLREDRKGR